MANYSIGVVGYVDRQDQLDMLHDTIMPDLVEVDDGTLGVMGNHLLTASKLYDYAEKVGSEWIVVLEDDAQPVLGFHSQLNALLDVAPSPVVSLYNGSGYPAQHQRKFAEAAACHDICWIMHPYLRHAVAYALHKEAFGSGLLDELIELDMKRWAPDDAISAWAKRWGTLVAYTNPSVVNHQDGPPVIVARRHFGMTTFGRNRPRRAHWVGTRPAYAWLSDSVTIA